MNLSGRDRCPRGHRRSGAAVTERARASALAALAIAALPLAVAAHQAGISYDELRVGDASVEARLRLSVAEAGTVVRIGGDAAGRVTEANVSAAAGELVAATLGALQLAADGDPCPLASGTASLEPPDGLLVTGRYACPHRIGRLAVDAAFVRRLPLGHTHLARVSIDGRQEDHVARAGAERFAVERARPWAFEAARFLALGFEHIFTGYDHLAFLLGLLLLGGGLRSLVAVVSSFTVAHSITLALAATGVLAPPARLVEPLIALTIVVVAAENLWALRSGEAAAHAVRSRWRLAFVFGLVHGFGLAGALRALDLPRSTLAASLLSFNLGVEAGQLAVVALAFPVLAWFRRRAGFVPNGVRAASSAIGVLGLLWLFQRL